MPGTIVHQVRAAASTDAGALYRITASCTGPGTLPDAAIFLLRVVASSDPKDDVYERLCSPADFTTYGTDRDQAALTNGFYRSWLCTFSYPDVAYANNVWAELSARINALVNDYDVFLTAFLTRDEGVDTIYPTIDLSTKNARIEAYKGRVAAVAAAEIARNDHQRTCRDVKALELTTVQTQLTQAQADLAAMRTIRSVTDVLAASYPSAAGSISTSITSAMVASDASSATSLQKLAVSTPLQAAQSAAQALTGYDARLIAEVQTPLAVQVGILESRVSDLTQGVSSAQSALAACDGEMSRLQGDVDEARRARDASLAAVREVCTDYVPLDNADGTLAASLSLLLGGL